MFALSGATAAVNRRFDIFGVLVLSFAAGNAGGMARDVLIGAMPPAAMNNWRYVGRLAHCRFDHVLLVCWDC